MFDLITSISVLVLLVALIIVIVSWLTDNPIAGWVADHAGVILRIVFAGAVVGSLIYSNYFDYAPCLLCWYQRLCIFPTAILLFTDDLRKSKLLQRQILLLTSVGFLIALFHNYIITFPQSGIDVCGTSGVSCLNLYVLQFGFVTIPFMSAVVLASGVLVTVLAMRYPQNAVANQ